MSAHHTDEVRSHVEHSPDDDMIDDIDEYPLDDMAKAPSEKGKHQKLTPEFCQGGFGLALGGRGGPRAIIMGT